MKRTRLNGFSTTDFAHAVADFLIEIGASAELIERTFLVKQEIDPVTKNETCLTLSQANFISCFTELIRKEPNYADKISEMLEEFINRWHTERLINFALVKFYYTLTMARLAS